jgi:hypothetical protein
MCLNELFWWEVHKMTGWQPIETAPKDGRSILIYRRPWPAPVTAEWSEHANYGGREDSRPGWQIWLCDEDHWYSIATDEATHWMPLPEPPKE